MTRKSKHIQQNPRETANPINRLFFWWMLDLFRKGARKDLEQSDLYAPLKSDESAGLGDRLEKAWNRELEKLKHLEYRVGENGQKKPMEKNTMPQLYKAIIRVFGLQYFVVGIFIFVQVGIMRTSTPILQGWIISYFNVNSDADKPTRSEALVYATLLVLNSFGVVFIMHHMTLKAQQIGMRVRVACSALVYRKILRLSKSAMTQTTGGQVVNLLSNDMNRFDMLPMFLNYIWIMPLQIIIVGFVMYEKIGLSALVGIGALLLLTVPIHWIFTMMSRRLRSSMAALTDRRVQLMNELIAGIQVVKMYAWEKPFSKIVSDTRISEVKQLMKVSCIRGSFSAIIMFTERVVLFVTLISYVLMGNPLVAEVTYVLSTYFNILQLSTVLFFPQALIMSGEAVVSMKRLEYFLLLDEVASDNVARASSVSSKSTPPEMNGKKNDAKIKESEANEKNEKYEKYEKYVKYEETEKSERISTESLNKEKEQLPPVFVEANRICANWIVGQLPPTICNVSFTVKPGKLCALVGPVGSGKSSILHMILNELPVGAGTLRILRNPHDESSKCTRGYVTDVPNFRISYASQEPWLFNGTVRENILLGQPYDRTKYLEVTKVCALTKDFRQLSQGDMTIVGERGISLSGGQRARINLARAVYKEADIYLLDDPLSAVDTRVARHLFKKCINGYLSNRTRILVTHQLQFLQKADNIVALNRGVVQMEGTYDELTQSNEEFVQMLNRIKLNNEDEVKEDEGQTDESNKTAAGKRGSFRRSIRRSSRTSTSSSMMSENDDCESVGSNRDEETMATGYLSAAVYRQYFRHGGSYFALFIVILFFLLTQLAVSGTDYWVSYWTNIETIKNNAENSSIYAGSVKHKNMFNNTFLSYMFTLDEHGLLTTVSAIYVYTFCIVSCIVFVLLRSYFFMRICMNASRKLHNAMFSNLLMATMRFFNVNPSGRILNRFSKDTGAMDELLPRAMLEAIQIFLVMLSVVIMELIINYWIVIPLFIMGTTFYILRLLYLSTAQNVKRLEGVAKSPVFSHVNATLNGLTVIRSSGDIVTEQLRSEFDRLQDIHSGAWYLTLSTAAAFGLFLDIIACLFIAYVCFSFLLMDTKGILGADVGLAISQSLILTGTLQYGVKQSAEVIAQMTAVERILQYTNLPKEGPMTTSNPPPATWPAKGRVTFKGVSMAYDRNNPPVLKNLNVTIESGWKIGVVGRTGAGKSSLISALFRLYADGMEGEIRIDGRDASTLGLHELRSRISIIPQEPVLFSESLRYNLDPFGQYDDVTLWDVLKEVELTDLALDQKVQTSGNNFSVGQRQLICLARAVLRNNRILVLDEATANIDSHTDTLIQQTLRTRFVDSTVITVAHRLNTVIDSDRIIVMEGGQIVEFGCPYELLRDKPTGYFAQMVSKTGREMARNLMELAELACQRNTVQRSLDLCQQSSNDSDTVTIIAEYAL